MVQIMGDGLPDGWVRFGLHLQPTEHSWEGFGYAGHVAVSRCLPAAQVWARTAEREQAERDRVAAERHEELIAKIAEAAPRSASP